MADAVGDQQPQEAEDQEAPVDDVQEPDAVQQPEAGPDAPPAPAASGPQRPAPPAQAFNVPDPGRQGGADNLQRMLDVPLDMTVELGRTEMQLAEVLRLEPGSVIDINRLPGEPIDLLVNGRLFAKGEVVVINDTFGYRITELVGQTSSNPENSFEGE